MVYGYLSKLDECAGGGAGPAEVPLSRTNTHTHTDNMELWGREESLCDRAPQRVPYLGPKHAKDCWHGAESPRNEAEQGVETELKAEVYLCLTTLRLLCYMHH